MNLPVLNCDGCGACCMEQAGLPASYFVGVYGPVGPTASGKPLPRPLVRQLKRLVKRWLKDGFPPDGSPCIWFDAQTRRCQHYEFRPELCRDGVEVGDDACRRWRAAKSIDRGLVHVADLSLFEYCAGVGMLGRAVALACESIGIGTEVVGCCELEAGAAGAFVAGLEAEGHRVPPVWDDARTLFGRRCRGLEPVDVVCAGYPCQPFSSAGRRAGSRDARHLWPAVRRGIARLKPGVVFLENVDAHVSLGAGKVLRDLRRIGYRVTAGLYSAEEVGAPHLRRRLFILALADAGGGGWESRAGRERMRGAGGIVGNAECSEPRRGGEAGQTPRERGRGYADSGDQLGDAEHGEPPGIRGCPPLGQLFPPGRTDYAAWARLLAGGLDPACAPAIERGVPVVADGLANSADLLRLGGNGVVPLCAAWAFLNLLAASMEPVATVKSAGPLFAAVGDGGGW